MKKAKLLWVDLEMTGLDAVRDRILEVSVIATDWKLDEVVRYNAVVFVNPGLAKRRMVGEFWEKNSGTRDELLRQNVAEGRRVREVEKEILALVGENFSGEVYLAGNSVYQDRKFIDRQWPELAGELHYRMLDVSAWKIWFENVKKVRMTKVEEHRAEGDVEDCIREFRKYLEYVK